ncbi:hypothetical protein KCU81_g6426, partial [Aureobasidium melanogenum]|uniref:Uncharacterized protein n=1 Tax=Aureobasidium melanogenum (strain CBS 110374) TaxID=1043003 RepID=A0A074VQL9_AURM1
MADPESQSAAPHKRKRDSFDEDTTAAKKTLTTTRKADATPAEKAFATSKISLRSQKPYQVGLLEEMKALPESGERSANIKDLEETRALPESGERSANIKDLEEPANALDLHDPFSLHIDESGVDSSTAAANIKSLSVEDMSTFPESPSSIHEVANSDSPSVASHKRKREPSEKSTTSRNLEESTNSIGHLEDLLEEMKASPESNERAASIKDLEDFTKALDSYDYERYEMCIDQNDLEDIIEMAEGEQFVEKLTRDDLKCAESKPPKNEDVAHALSYFMGPSGGAEVKKLVAAVAESKPPKNEDVTRALSYFMGPSGEAEGKKLVAAVTNTVSALGESDDEDILKCNAEPVIIDLIIN